MPDYDDYSHENHDEPPSKSAVKRQMTALQKLGESLLKLSDKQLQQVPLDNEALELALAEAKRIRSHSAHKRHLQYIGKLMRDMDPAPIEAALAKIFAPQQRENEAFHALEQLRDQLLSEGDAAIQSVVERWPQTDRQHLRQLLLQHQREQQKGKPPVASRKLFKYLRELQQGE